MKPFVQKLPFAQNNSFLAQTFKTPDFEVPWHQHAEYEFALFTAGEGMNFVGNYVGEFKTGDVFFLGANVPHAFLQKDQDFFTSAVVIQFREDFWGKDFMGLPESRDIRQIFEVSMQGLKFYGKSKALLRKLITDLEGLTGFDRIIALCKCLSIVALRKEYVTLSTLETNQFNLKEKERIDKIFQNTINGFHEPISLAKMAGSIGMSVPAFCNYFKKSTNKTYINFLNEVRIGYACNLLINSHLTVSEICYQSGYNTLANFNKQFFKIKKYTPSQFRKIFIKQNNWDG